MWKISPRIQLRKGREANLDAFLVIGIFSFASGGSGRGFSGEPVGDPGVLSLCSYMGLDWVQGVPSERR